ALGRYGLSRRPGGCGDPSRGADHLCLRRVLRDDGGAPARRGSRSGGCPRRAPAPRGPAVRPDARRDVLRARARGCEVLAGYEAAAARPWRRARRLPTATTSPTTSSAGDSSPSASSAISCSSPLTERLSGSVPRETTAAGVRGSFPAPTRPVAI